MEPEGWSSIRSNWMFLREELDVDDVMPLLFQKEAIELEDMDAINECTKRTEKVEKLLRALKDRPGSFEVFCTALSSRKQAYISDELMKQFKKVGISGTEQQKEQKDKTATAKSGSSKAEYDEKQAGQKENTPQSSTLEEEEMKGKDRPVKSLLACALDVTENDIGYAFSFKHEYDLDPLRITSKNWHNTRTSSLSHKLPACILISPDGKDLVALGFEAEEKYAELVEADDHHNYYYFNRFVRTLFAELVQDEKFELQDDTGKKISAISVLSMTVRYLQESFLGDLQKRLGEGEVVAEDVKFLLVVPSIVQESGKSMMKDVAKQGDISNESTTIILEHEAAATYCNALRIENRTWKEREKYMVLHVKDDGYFDVLVLEDKGNKSWHLLHHADGKTDLGNKFFLTFYTRIFKSFVLKQVEQKAKDEFDDMRRNFDLKLRDIDPNTTFKVNFKMPSTMLEVLREEHGDLAKAIRSSRYGNKMDAVGDKLRIDSKIVTDIYAEVGANIFAQIKAVLGLPAANGVQTITTIGQGSDTTILQDMVRRKFPSLDVIVPPRIGLEVLKGAVIYGHLSPASN